jgi:hypothetical protein
MPKYKHPTANGAAPHIKNAIEQVREFLATQRARAMEQVRESLATQHARFRAAEPKPIYSRTGELITVEEHIPNQLGYWKHIKSTTGTTEANPTIRSTTSDLVYLIDPRKFRTEVCRGFRATDIAKQLDGKGLLVHRKGKIKHREQVTLPSGDKKRLWFYAVKARILEGEKGVGEKNVN